MTHHSLLKRENGDAIIIGASSTKHLEENLADLEKGPLPQDVLDALDQGWEGVRGLTTRYVLCSSLYLASIMLTRIQILALSNAFKPDEFATWV